MTGVGGFACSSGSQGVKSQMSNKHYRKQPRPQGPPRVASHAEGPGYEVVTGL